MTDTQQLIEDLEHEWDQDGGFLGLLRKGTFSDTARARFFELLDSIDLTDHKTIDRRVVSLLWSIPTFMAWQRERVAENGHATDILDASINDATDRLMKILGAP